MVKPPIVTKPTYGMPDNLLSVKPSVNCRNKNGYSISDSTKKKLNQQKPAEFYTYRRKAWAVRRLFPSPTMLERG